MILRIGTLLATTLFALSVHPDAIPQAPAAAVDATPLTARWPGRY